MAIENLYNSNGYFAFKGDYEGSQGYLNHGSANNNNKLAARDNSLVAVRGTDRKPDAESGYAKTSIFSEMHTNAQITKSQSVWGNPYKVGGITSEVIARGAAKGEFNGGVFRAYSTDKPTGSSAQKILVGISAIGQTNTGSTNGSWGVWGANFVAAQTSGSAPENCVGIEVDVIHTSSARAYTGPKSGSNFTAFWAQADGKGVCSSAVLYASKTAQSAGWNYLIFTETDYSHWMLSLKNTKNHPNARGVLINTRYGAGSGRILECQINGDPRFFITGDVSNPVWMRLGRRTSNIRKKAFSNLSKSDQVLVAV